MKTLFIFLLLSATCLQTSEAQCKFKGIPAKLRRYCVSDNKPKPDATTKLTLLFDRFYFVGQAAFAKDAGHYYLYLHLARNFSKRFELKPANALVLTTATGKTVEVFPVADFSGKNMLTWFAVGCYYGLTKEQLQILSSEKVVSFRLSVHSETEIETTKDDGGNGWQKDQNGQVFFKHTIEAETKKEKFQRGAACLLNKK